MDKELLIDLYQKRGINEKKTQAAVLTVEQLEHHLQAKNIAIDAAAVDDIKEYIAVLFGQNRIDLEKLLAIARYFYLIDKHNIYIYFTKLLGGMGVLENIKKRTEKYAGKETAEKIFKGISFPPLGTPIEKVPEYTKKLMHRIEQSLPPDLYKKILAGNNHGVPKESMQDEKDFYEKSENLEQYLKERHERKVAELQEYCDAGRIWFEQEITQPVVDFVKSNQEILSAVKKGNKLYVTKIPYDTVGFLTAETDKDKNYYACHCTFAREAIINDEENFPSDWCYCSAGFAKFPFEVILGKELGVKVLNSALDGEGFCRFEIDLGESEG